MVADVPSTNQDASQEFLDNSQYTEAGILKYEFVFGPGFISTVCVFVNLPVIYWL